MVRAGGSAGKRPTARFGVTRLSAPHTSDDRILIELIATIGSTRQVAEIGRRVVDILATVDGVREVLLFIWDADVERLVLQAAGPAGAVTAGHGEYKLGEGVVGRSALGHGRPAIGTIAVEPPASRPRAQLVALGGRVPALAVRVATAGDDELLGVIGVVGDTREALSPALARTVTAVGRLLALAIEGERSRAAGRAAATTLRALDVVAPAAAAGSSGWLDPVAQLGVEATAAAACAIYVADRSSRDLRLAAVAPADAPVPPRWPGTVPGGPAAATLTADATMGSDRLGLLVLTDDHARTFTAADAAVAHRLAQIVAVATRQRRLLESSIERVRGEDLLWELVGARPADPLATLARAQRLGCDVREPHVALVAHAAAGPEADRLRGLLLAADRNALVDMTTDRVVALVTAAAVGTLPAGGWSVGISRPCRDATGYPAAYQQAQEALELGLRLFGRGRVVRFEDLGSYRFVPALIQYGLTTEAEYQQVSRLPDELLQTLEAYLDSGGNTAQAAKQLFLHRNTLRQRLERITALLDLDLSAPSRWLSLQLAIKTARMSRLSGKPAPGIA